MSGIGIVIVTHNSEAEIGACLDAALATGEQLLVIDNASRDQTQAQVIGRGVALTANPSNRGFAGAVNQGIRALSQDLILLLNPDVVLQSSLEPLRRACGSSDVAAAGGRLVDEHGSTQIGFNVRRFPSALTLSLEALLVNRLWPRNPVNRRYRCFDLDHRTEMCVDQPAGAFLMLRRDIWLALGGFDEDFHPLWFEDVDYCRRARERGYRVYYVPSAVAKHTGGHSVRKMTVENRVLYWYGSLLTFTRKHFGEGAGRGVCVAVLAGSFLRMAAGIFQDRSLKPIAVYGKVARMAARQFIRGERIQAHAPY